MGVVDLTIVLLYLAVSVGVGFWVSRAASADTRSYFLGGNRLPWYALGLSNASGMFDISGTMWLVFLLFVFGLKSLWIPWLWPTFNQIFLMVFLSMWLRRSGVMTGAEWIAFRFGDGPGARLSHLVVVVFALVSVIGFLAYGFVGVGKFAATFLPLTLHEDPQRNEIYYGLIIVGLTSLYVIKGGMFSVVITEVLQFLIMTIACIAVGIIAMNAVSAEQLAAATPEGWTSPFFGYEVNMDWSGILPSANQWMTQEDYSPFALFFVLMVFKGIMVSLAGPAPNYDMQRVLSARTPREAALMSAVVSVVLNPPRYLLVAGLAVLALVFFMPELRAQGADADFELILPFALKHYVPAGLLGILVAGLLAAFMSTFAATVNAAPAYVVNDLYRRYINPHASEKTYVRASYITAAAFVIIGTLIGLQMPSLNNLIIWLVSALFGGYAAANVLKWYWWRFNGYGYFAGMATGVLIALWLARQDDTSALYAFPAMFGITAAACVLGALLTPPTDMDTLTEFYRRTRPWGLWGPVRRELEARGSTVAANGNFARDMFNVAVGVIWQLALVAAPIYLVIRDMSGLWISVAVAVLTTVILKFTWYDRLEDYPRDLAEERPVTFSEPRSAPA